jgi:hypothetical protein
VKQGYFDGFVHPKAIRFSDSQFALVAARAFGCNPEARRNHYIALEEQDLSDRVMQAIQSKGEIREISARTETSHPERPDK